MENNMLRRLTHFVWIVLIALALVGQPATARPVLANDGSQGRLFIKQAGPELRLNGKIFRFAGTNNYYLMYKSQFMVDDVLTTAAANGFRVLRMWGSLDIGNQDGSNSIQGKADGVYFQYWDSNAPAYNDGADGLEKLDYAIYRAGQLGLRVVIPFTNNWNAFGGMDQYVRWANGQYHDQFYTDPQIRQWYKNWIAHLLNRTNTYSHLKYKNDPTIMTWELANEPRCLSAGAYPRSATCTTQTLITWANEMSTFIKTIDPKHLISVGDEGFYCIPGASDWTENCGEGVDTIAFTKLPNINVMSFHLYPDHWGKTTAWGTQWIQRHFAEARALGKPAMLGEFGWQGKATRNPVFKEWTDAVFTSKGAGALYWILSGKQDGGDLYADYDGFTVYCPSPVCITLNNFATAMNSGMMGYHPPVADDDTATTEFETAVTLAVMANDITYGGASLASGSIDLDPTAAGRQTTQSVYGGQFNWQPDGTVLFTPSVGFSGKAAAVYTIQDSYGQTSNKGGLLVTVKPNPTGAQTLFSFETGTEGWGPANWQTGAGSVQTTATFHTDGFYGLEVDSANGGWFGVAMPGPVDITGKTHFKFDLQTNAAGTSREVALQFGDSWTWCEGGGWGWTNPSTTTMVDIDLTALSCANPDTTKLQGLFVWFSGGGTFYIDNVRVE
jgi:mannan endo-1,4-beta-mannosidase